MGRRYNPNNRSTGQSSPNHPRPIHVPPLDPSSFLRSAVDRAITAATVRPGGDIPQITLPTRPPFPLLDGSRPPNSGNIGDLKLVPSPTASEYPAEDRPKRGDGKPTDGGNIGDFSPRPIERRAEPGDSDAAESPPAGNLNRNNQYWNAIGPESKLKAIAIEQLCFDAQALVRNIQMNPRDPNEPYYKQLTAKISGIFEEMSKESRASREALVATTAQFEEMNEESRASREALVATTAQVVSLIAGISTIDNFGAAEMLREFMNVLERELPLSNDEIDIIFNGYTISSTTGVRQIRGLSEVLANALNDTAIVSAGLKIIELCGGEHKLRLLLPVLRKSKESAVDPSLKVYEAEQASCILEESVDCSDYDREFLFDFLVDALTSIDNFGSNTDFVSTYNNSAPFIVEGIREVTRRTKKMEANAHKLVQVLNVINRHQSQLMPEVYHNIAGRIALYAQDLGSTDTVVTNAIDNAIWKDNTLQQPRIELLRSALSGGDLSGRVISAMHSISKPENKIEALASCAQAILEASKRPHLFNDTPVQVTHLISLFESVNGQSASLRGKGIKGKKEQLAQLSNSLVTCIASIVTHPDFPEANVSTIRSQFITAVARLPKKIKEAHTPERLNKEIEKVVTAFETAGRDFENTFTDENLNDPNIQKMVRMRLPINTPIFDKIAKIDEFRFLALMATGELLCEDSVSGRFRQRLRTVYEGLDSTIGRLSKSDANFTQETVEKVNRILEMLESYLEIPRRTTSP